ncbi:CoA transferase [Leifsonia sp. H3M29-4]|uniref:CoA transferase n=1 Tax=Salinibacterium metalliresistens TaxID=3031321 RepID=UPI0023DC385B|nr:CoA transferase [Salinibacterium metalliresistens]MDF1480242.1 CoA transferase [Salinibacterium metalliresistens]
MSVLAAAWRALDEDPAALSLVRDHGESVPLSSTLAVGPLVHDAIAAASLSAALLAARRSGTAVPTVELDPVRIATAVTSERHFRLAGEPVNAFAELSGFWPTADGWVRTHANYPHHRARLIGALGLGEDATADDLRHALRQRSAIDVEEAVTAAGGIAVAVRTEQEWARHPHAAAVAQHPLLGLRRLGDATPAGWEPGDLDAPAAGIRVLDLTRVIAGPVATRTLALWGADVLRIDSPSLPEIAWQHLDSGAGKRSALLDLAADPATFERLLAEAHVVVTGYRPGSLDALGLSPEALARRRPGIVVARLSAWGDTGPFASRRGFDSIVQAATGIGWLEGDGTAPGALPAQALDHAAGYLLAAGITSALRRRHDEGGAWLVETNLARVAQQLLEGPRGERRDWPSWQPTVITTGEVTSTAAAPHYDDGPDSWATPAVPWGSSAPQWVAR